MILLSGHSLTQQKKVPLEALSITLKERDSTASMTPADMTGIGVNSWLQDDTDPGKGIVWRVRNVKTAFATNTTTVELEHVISTLKDTLLFGEVTPATITGNKNATTCTAIQAVRYILGKQNIWTLGSFDYNNVTGAYKFDGDSLFDALETVSGTLDDCWWTLDTTVYPFKIHINMRSTTAESEMRASRNIQTITRTIDRAGMYTRIYPIGKNDIHLSGSGYIEKNTAAYGVVEHVETEQGCATEAELRQWATLRLAKHCEPVVNIEIEGVELADATGVSVDRLRLGRICRVPLPEFNTTITERIVSLAYNDKLRAPEVVKVTLANQKDDVTRIIADQIKSGGKGGRASARKDKEDLAWFEDTNDHVAMCAKGIIGTDARGNPNWTRLSEIVVNGDGIYSQVTGVMGDLKVAETKIEQNEYEISLRATRGEMNSAIEVSAGKITQYVNSEDDKLKSSINVEKNRISLVVEGTGSNAKIKPASIVASINDGASNIKLSADHIDIDGLVNKLVGYDISAESLTAHQITSEGECTFDTVVVDSLQVNGFTNVIVDAEVSGNTLTLTFDDESTVTFSKATTLSGAWSGGVFTVSASPQGNTKSSTITSVLANGEVTFASGILTVPIKVMAKIDSGSAEETGYTQNFLVSATKAINSVTVSSVTNNQSSTTLSYVKITATASNNNTGDLWLYLVKNGNYVELRKTSATGTRIARLSIA